MKSIKLGGFTIENIETINDNFSELDSGKAAKAEVPTKTSQLTNDSGYQTAAQLANVVKNVSYAEGTGVFTFTTYDDQTFTIDTAIEKVVANFTYNAEKQALVLTLADGTAQEIPMSAFIKAYTGGTTASGTISISPEGAITFNLAAGAVGMDKLASDVTDKLSGIDSSLAQKVDKVTGKGLSTNDYTTEEKNKLAGLQNYILPVAGDALGGVKNGGNVVINGDGTMNATMSVPDAFKRIDFAATDSWTDDATLGTQTYKKLTVAADGKSPLAAFRKNGEKFEQVCAYLAVNGTSVDIAFIEAFDGYVICV